MSRPVKTILVAALVCLTLAGVFVVLAEGPKKPPTELYVRTDPPAAKIFVDGKEVGTSPGLFEVKPGLHQIVVELAGHDPGRKEVVVPETEITRVIFELTKRAKGPAGTFPGGPASPAFERELPVGPALEWDPRFRVDLPDNDALDLDTGQTVRAPERLSDVFDVLWDNDAGGVLMCNFQGPARLLPLPDQGGFQQAVREARNQLDRLKGSFIKARPAAETRHFAVLTDQGRLAVVEVTRAKPEEGRICWSLFQLQPQRGGPARLTPIKQPAKAVSASEAAQRILRTYAEAAWDELLPKTEKADPQQAPAMVVRAASEIAARHILPQKDLVTRYLLGPLPQAPPIDQSQWTSALRRSQFEGVPPLGEQGFWSPLAVAQTYRAFVVGEELGAEMLAKRSMLEDFAPVPGVLLDASLDHPEIATAYGNELIVARLERDEAGLYHCREVEWLQRKPDGTQGYSLLPPDATPAQRLIRQYSDAVWARLLPRLGSLSFNEIMQETERIAEVHLVPRPDLLLEESRRILAKLPQAGLPDRSQWRPRSPRLIAKAPSDAEAEAALEKLAEGLPKGESRPLYWDPVRLARGIRMSLFAELEGPEWFGRRAMIEAVALYPPDAAADADPNHPVIVTRTGNEMTVVALQRNEAGCYDLARFEWLVRVDGPAEGTLAKAADGRVYRSAAERDAVAALEQLGALILRDSNGSPHTVHLKGTKATNLELVHLEGLPHLKHLDLFGTNISDNGLAHLGQLAELERLELNGTGTTDAGLEHLKALTNLRILNLAETEVSDAGLVHLAGMNRLESLTLYATKLTDAGLAHLQGLTSLVNLSLGCTQVTDAGLAHLEALKRLEGLDLRHTKVSDAGLEHVEALTELRSLTLDGTAVTEAGLNKLRQKLPRLDRGRLGPRASDPAGQPGPSEVDRAIELIERHHAAGVDRSDLAAAAIQGMLDKFDPDSAYVGLEEMGLTDRELGQGLVGVGLELKFDDEAGELVVITPLPDMPAHKAGVRAGDRVVAIDGQPAGQFPHGKELQTAVKLLRGKAGEAVTVTIERAGSEASHQITIVRAPIRIETVLSDTRKPDGSWQLMLDEARKIGYVRLVQFGPRSAEELEAALNRLTSQGMKGLILDLRNNPGGSLPGLFCPVVDLTPRKRLS